MGLAELKIHHIGYVVEDLEDTISHLQAEYGIAFGEPYYFRPDKAWVNGIEEADYCLKIAMSAGPAEDAPFAALIEVIEPVKGEGVHAQFIKSGNSGLQHICYSVKDYDRWHAFFEEKAAKIVFEAEVEDDRFGYRRCFYAEDEQTGIMFEIKEEPYFRK